MVDRLAIDPLHGLVAMSEGLALPGDAVGVVVVIRDRTCGADDARTHAVGRHLTASGFASVEIDDGNTAQTVDRIHGELPTAGLPIGTFGVGSGGAEALRAAARQPGQVRTAVSCGGRPDELPRRELSGIEAPVMLIVGDRDSEAIRTHETCATALRAPESALEIIAGAEPALADPDAAELIADLSCGWFRRHLGHGMPVAAETAGG